MVRVTQVARARRVRQSARPAGWPCASARPRKPQGSQAHATGRAGTTGRLILVVDDEIAVRMICSFNLEAAGLEVQEAVDGDEALAAVRERRPDLVLLDVMMPKRDGWAVAAELRADPETRDLPVVFLTARVDEADRRRAHQLGVVGYITKPFDPIALAAQLEEILDRLARGEREQLRAELLRGWGS
jgi:two-component system, OmpR family, alkaline phosphatase synthesis response regulator PhoP